MAVYVDDEQIAWRGKVWCHMVADTPDELHAFATEIGLRRAWFQGDSVYPHYDVTLAVRAKALYRGAVLADRPMILAAAKRMKNEIRRSEEVFAAIA